MEGTRPITLSLAATILMLFAFVNLAVPLMRGPGDANNASVSGQLLERQGITTSNQTQSSGQRQSASGFGAFGGNSSASGPDIPALILLCVAMLISALAFFGAVGLLQTRLYGLVLAIIASAVLLFFSAPSLLASVQSGMLTSLPLETAIEIFTGAATLILVLLPVSLRAFRKRKDEPEDSDH